MTNQDPSQTPRECPACNAPIVAEDLCYGGHLIEYTCGAMFNSRIQEWGGRCSSAFSAAVSLRAERDAALAQVESWRKRIEAHMDYVEPKIDRAQENADALTARVGELQAVGRELSKYRANMMYYEKGYCGGCETCGNPPYPEADSPEFLMIALTQIEKLCAALASGGVVEGETK